MRVPFKLNPGVWSAWSLSVDGTRFVLSVDGRPRMKLEHPSFGPMSGSSLAMSGRDPVQFDDVEVVRPPAAGTKSSPRP